MGRVAATLEWGRRSEKAIFSGNITDYRGAIAVIMENSATIDG